MIAFSLGILLGCLIPTLPAARYFLLLLIPPLLACCIPVLRLLAAYCLGLLWFLLWAQSSTQALLPKELEREDIWVKGEIVSLPETGQFSSGFHFRVSAACAQSQLEKCDFSGTLLQGELIQLNVYQALKLAPGQQWLWKVRLKRPHGFQNPGGFDYEAWLWQQGIRGAGYVREDVANEHIGDSGFNFQSFRFAYRQQLNELNKEQPLQQQSLIRALSIGDRQGITDSDWDLFSATGTNHLMVISGMHLGFVAWLLFALFSQICKRFASLCLYVPAQRLAAFLSIPAAYCYAQIAGFALPVQRAFIMLAAFMVGYACCRHRSVYDSYVLALFLVLLLNPLAPVSAGFWLSFVAVGVLITFLEKEQLKQRDYLQRFSLFCKAQLIVFLGLLPFMLLIFQQSSLSAPVSNLLAIPYITILVVPLCLLGLILSPLSPVLFKALYSLLDKLLSIFITMLENLVSLWPQAQLALPALGVWQWAYFLSMMLVLLYVLKARQYRFAFFSALALIPGLWPLPEKLATGEFRLDILDVGQGQAVTVRTQNHALLYDLGPRYSDSFNAGEGVILPFLKAKNINKINRVIVSHGDNDHAGGLTAVLDAFPQADYLSSDLSIFPDDTDADLCRSGLQWRWDDVSFIFLHPEQGFYNSNNASCVLKISNASYSVLLPGDIENSVERELLQARKNLAADILLAPHHGSKTSSHLAFVNAVNPGYTVFSSGYLNQFSHPAPEVVNLYTNSGTITFNTAETGAISWLIPNRGELEAPELFRLQNRRVWRSLNSANVH